MNFSVGLKAKRKWKLQAITMLVPAAALAMQGCKVGPDYKPPATSVPSEFSEIGSATRPATRGSTRPGSSTRPMMLDEHPQDFRVWWTTFNDPILSGLIERAAKQNFDVIAAAQRVRQARAERGVATAPLFPVINTNGSLTHSRSSGSRSTGFTTGGSTTSSGGTTTGGTTGGTNTGGTTTGGTTTGGTTTGGTTSSNNTVVSSSRGFEGDIYQAGFDASWELDVFGGIQRSVESADYSLQAAVEDRRDVLIVIMGEVASRYVDLRGAQRELAITEENLRSQQQTLNLTRSKAEGGLIPYLDVAQQEAQVASTDALIPTLQIRIRQDIHQLGILLGQNPGSLSDELSPTKSIPVGPPSVPPGVPSELLRRRPDVRRAERQLAAATANIGVATADLFPKFSLTGNFGFQSNKVKNLFDWNSRFYSIGPGVTWNIFDAGQIQYNIEVQNAVQAQALATYEKAVDVSLGDVEDSLVAYNREQVRLDALRNAVDANQRAVDLSLELFNKGSKDFLSVLDAQRSLFAAQDAMVQSETAVSTDLVSLYKALGGGWETE